jgi:hypothetical protein
LLCPGGVDDASGCSERNAADVGEAMPPVTSAVKPAASLQGQLTAPAAPPDRPAATTTIIAADRWAKPLEAGLARNRGADAALAVTPGD